MCVLLVTSHNSPNSTTFGGHYFTGSRDTNTYSRKAGTLRPSDGTCSSIIRCCAPQSLWQQYPRTQRRHSPSNSVEGAHPRPQMRVAVTPVSICPVSQDQPACSWNDTELPQTTLHPVVAIFKQDPSWTPRADPMPCDPSRMAGVL